MSKTFHCDIVSATQEIFSGEVEMVIATGMLGALGILPGHTPLLTGLKPGPVRLLLPGGDTEKGAPEEVFYASGGFLEVQPNIVTILSDTALRAEDLDEAAAQEAKAKAEKLLADQGGDFQFGLAAAQLAEAAAQLQALERFRNRHK